MSFEIKGGNKLEMESTAGLRLLIIKIANEKCEISIFSEKLTLTKNNKLTKET